MLGKFKSTKAVELVLLPVLQTVEKTVTVGCLHHNPRADITTPSRNKVQVSIVARHRNRWVQPRSRPVSGRKILRVVPLPHIESASIHLDTPDDQWDENVRVRITVAVSIRREIVGDQVTSDLNVGRDGFAVVSGNSRRKVLR